MPSWSKVAVLALGALGLVDAKACPPMGSVLPAPTGLSQSSILKETTAKLKAGLDAEAKKNFNSSGVSIIVKSIHEDTPLFNYHFTPPNTGIGAKSVNENTVFRLASGSKLITVLAALREAKVDMNASILKYLPQLKEHVSKDPVLAIAWEDVTLSSLAGHLSGVGVDLAMDLGLAGDTLWEKLGLPAIPKGKGPTCSGLFGTSVCTSKDLLEQVNLRPAVYAPDTNPVYSNIGIALLATAVEAATKKSIEEIIQDSIFDVVGMKNSYMSSPPPQKHMFIPEGDESFWNISTGVFNAAGGIWSTAADMAKLAEGILSNKFLSAAKTRQWMKPDVSTASWTYLVGQPWEIYRSDNITSDGRLIDVYTKSGDLFLQHSVTALIPDYDLVFTIMLAGAEVSASIFTPTAIFSSVLEAILPAVEAIGREEAKEAYVGTYKDTATKSSLTITMDKGPGLLISEWKVRGFDVLHNLDAYGLATIEDNGKIPKSNPVVARVYPTNLKSKGQTAWRAVFDEYTAADVAEADAEEFFKQSTCQTWLAQDRSTYNRLPLDEFIFIEGSNDKAKAIKSPIFNVTLTKVRPPAEKKATSSAARAKKGGKFSDACWAVLAALFGLAIVF